MKSKWFSAAIHNTSFSNIFLEKVNQCNWAVSAQGTGLGPRRAMFHFPFHVTDLHHLPEEKGC